MSARLWTSLPVAACFALAAALHAQTTASVPGRAELESAYQALKAKNWDAAITSFRAGLQLQPANAAAHKDLAYTLLKTGENADARDEFAAAMRLAKTDETAALEFAFLAFETKQPAEARRTFQRLRFSKDAKTRTTAETAYQNIDRPLAEGIQRWTEAIRHSANPDAPNMFSAHWELAQLAAQRDEWTLASEQYDICRKLRPFDGDVLLALADAWSHADRVREANALLLAASRWQNTRAAELARERFGPRYPYPYEFVDALKLDPGNLPLRKELAYLYLAMHQDTEATEQFRQLLQYDSQNREVLNQLTALEAAKNSGLKTRSALPSPVTKPSAREMGMKSFALGYSLDAIRYLRQAHEENPDDAEVTLKLGYAYNLAHNDADAIRWFDLARRVPDPAIAAEAAKAYRNLNGDTLPRAYLGVLPVYSTRWHDLIADGQFKQRLPLPWTVPHHWFSLYLSTRFMGDMRSLQQGHSTVPTYLSASSVIIGAGFETRTWHHVTGWAEAGEAVQYLPFRHDLGTATPDYRGGLSFLKGFGTLLGSKHSGFFSESAADFVYLSRFDKDWQFHLQQRFGRTIRVGDTSLQLLVNANFSRDLKNQYWANALEFGPGLKLHLPGMPESVYFTADALHGVYTRNEYNPKPPNYNDVRLGFQYAFSK